MAIKGKIGDFSYNDERARGGNHPAVIMSGLFALALVLLPVGLLLARGLDGKLTSWLKAMTGVLGEGDGTEKTFVFDLKGPIVPGTLVIDDGVEAFTDDGFGTLTGDGATTPGTGKIDYRTGKGTVTFKTAPLAEADIEATWEPVPVGVLDEDLDTDRSTSGLYIRHGSVRKDVLKVPADAGGYEAPAAAMLKTLEDAGIYPE
ncbi:hypothetical protein SAMN05660653_00182 [Desulfonatronum thiosulfatophilum]|uniref:Uncharacterized protein n=1 Tax=Desulfonatronum thiosulfatophilum TaxID=617002 RepID=A0A1G6A6K7_9BACT|nr:hypothetical protein [Desulfonatronum thiosulfatophilum]SDB03936.1 hypothetical protein SAMN05660653_00182 [Desulfonatronum thiosulfatophilum]